MNSFARLSTLLPLLLAVASHAQTTTEPASSAPVTRDYYRACLAEGDKVAEEKASVDTQREAHAVTLKALIEEGKALAEEKTKLKTDDEKAVDAFNAKIKASNERGDAANAKSDQINKERDAYNAHVVDFNKRCATLVVRSADKEAVMQERAAAKAKK